MYKKLAYIVPLPRNHQYISEKQCMNAVKAVCVCVFKNRMDYSTEIQNISGTVGSEQLNGSTHHLGLHHGHHPLPSSPLWAESDHPVWCPIHQVWLLAETAL